MSIRYYTDGYKIKWKTLQNFSSCKVFQNIQQTKYLVVQEKVINKHVRLLILRHLASYY